MLESEGFLAQTQRRLARRIDGQGRFKFPLGRVQFTQLQRDCTGLVVTGGGHDLIICQAGFGSAFVNGPGELVLIKQNPCDAVITEGALGVQFRMTLDRATKPCRSVRRTSDCPPDHFQSKHWPCRNVARLRKQDHFVLPVFQILAAGQPTQVHVESGRPHAGAADQRTFFARTARALLLVCQVSRPEQHCFQRQLQQARTPHQRGILLLGVSHCSWHGCKMHRMSRANAWSIST